MILDDTVAAIVTGGASGAGEAAARALAARGVGVTIFDLDEAGAAVARQIGGQFLKVDITSSDSVRAGLAEARQTFGQERILVNLDGNARVATLAAAGMALLDRLPKGERGVILNAASGIRQPSAPGLAPYGIRICHIVPENTGAFAALAVHICENADLNGDQISI